PVPWIPLGRWSGGGREHAHHTLVDSALSCVTSVIAPNPLGDHSVASRNMCGDTLPPRTGTSRTHRNRSSWGPSLTSIGTDRPRRSFRFPGATGAWCWCSQGALETSESAIEQLARFNAAVQDMT